MTSFIDDFPDSDILSILGDDITVTDNLGISSIVKGDFTLKSIDDGLGNLGDINDIAINYPSVEIDQSESDLFSFGYTVVHQNKTYSVLRLINSDVGKMYVILKDKYV